MQQLKEPIKKLIQAAVEFSDVLDKIESEMEPPSPAPNQREIAGDVYYDGDLGYFWDGDESKKVIGHLVCSAKGAGYGHSRHKDLKHISYYENFEPLPKPKKIGWKIERGPGKQIITVTSKYSSNYVINNTDPIDKGFYEILNLLLADAKTSELEL
jgi:hypothetical protein